MGSGAKATRPYKKRDPETYNKSQGDRLKPYHWKPGQSGNPTGRPNGAISLTTELKMYLKRHPEALEGIVKTLIKEGLTGNIIAIKETFDRVDGKVAETHKLEGTLPVVLNFMPAEALLKSSPAALNDGRTVEGEIREID